MSSELFITKIRIDKVRDIENLESNLSETERKHLIITGKNGSGKTSVLLEIKKFLDKVNQNEYKNYVDYNKQIASHRDLLDKNNLDLELSESLNKNINTFLSILKEFGKTEI